MSKIKFSLIDSYNSDNAGKPYILTMVIHEQDMTWKQGSTFEASNGIKIDTTCYAYMCVVNYIFLLSSNPDKNSDKGFAGNNTSCFFRSYEDMIKYKERAILALKEWSNEKN